MSVDDENLTTNDKTPDQLIVNESVINLRVEERVETLLQDKKLNKCFTVN